MGQRSDSFNTDKIEKKVGYVFKDKGLLKRAFTLASYDKDDNNQTLEFFGDAIIEFLVSEKIFDENKSEGELTEIRQKLVSDKALTPVSQKLGLDKFLIRGKNDDNNKKAVPSVYEALVAAVYLDGGLKNARKFVRATLAFEDKPDPDDNYKGKLQELMQGEGKERPEYETVDKGTKQKPVFITRVRVAGKTFTGGEAGSKSAAEKSAARVALEALTDGK